jgi:hypothetical protein
MTVPSAALASATGSGNYLVRGFPAVASPNVRVGLFTKVGVDVVSTSTAASDKSNTGERQRLLAP